jgi:hypothetical protein
MQVIKGNLLDMPAGEGNYIVQQCCCTSTRTAGLSQVIAKKWPSLNPYCRRKPVDKTYTSTVDSRPYHGTAEIMIEGATKLICLYGQYGPGKPGIYEDDFIIMPDGAEDRLRYFGSALEQMAALLAVKKELLAPQKIRLHFPYGIGCGLAGGDWRKYEAALKEFADRHKEFEVVVVKLP